MDDREGLEWILRTLIFESPLISGPGGTFNVESVDADTLLGYGEGLLNATVLTSDDFLEHVGLRLD